MAAALVEAGINARVEGYNHTVRANRWKIVTDASIRAASGGEVVSPVLSGEDGIEELVKVVKALRAAGATVNRSCGLHVHVGVSDLLPKDLVNIVKRYADYEETIDGFMPASRRGQSAQWCNSVIPFSRELQRRSRNYSTNREVCDAQRGRYYKVNLTPYRRQKTLEYRQHAGTCNYRKVESWVRFLLQFTDASLLSTPDERSSQRRRSTSTNPRRGLNGVAAKMERVRLALLASDSHTLSRIAIGALGSWNVSSVPSYISRMRRELGLDIRAVRTNGLVPSYRIHGDGVVRRPEDQVATEHLQAARSTTVTEEESLFRGVDATIRRYYTRRAARLVNNTR